MQHFHYHMHAWLVTSPIIDRLHPTAVDTNSGRHAGVCSQVWDPTLIIAQILSMQFLFYLSMGLVQMVALSEYGQNMAAAAAAGGRTTANTNGSTAASAAAQGASAAASTAPGACPDSVLFTSSSPLPTSPHASTF
jgi:hypothetical protein